MSHSPIREHEMSSHSGNARSNSFLWRNDFPLHPHIIKFDEEWILTNPPLFARWTRLLKSLKTPSQISRNPPLT